jgi:hypothetical protein
MEKDMGLSLIEFEELTPAVKERLERWWLVEHLRDAAECGDVPRSREALGMMVEQMGIDLPRGVLNG